MEAITSLDNKRIKNLSKLLIKKYRDEEKKFLVEGEHLVEEAYKAGVLLEVVKCPDYERDFNVPTTLVSYDVIKKLSSTLKPQKVIGVCKYFEEKELGKRMVILDDLQDPGNLGTIIRSCVAFNVDTLVVSPNTVSIYNDKVLRSSEGMIFHLDIVVRDIVTLIDELQRDDYVIFGTKVDGGINIKEVDIPDKFAVIMGNEGAGVSSNILDKCDKYMYIRMNNKCESLNVGVATSIILYELF